jgi:hypothetical protein
MILKENDYGFEEEIVTVHQRYSPVSFLSEPAQTEIHDGWKVVLKYSDEGNGPFLIDLSHRNRWDVQDAHLSKIKPSDVAIPENPGQCIFKKGLLINRMNPTQAAVWHLMGDIPHEIQDTAYTHITEGSACLALVGSAPCVFSIMEKVTSLDLLFPGIELPFLVQGPVSHVPCQVVVLQREEKESAVIFTCSRGYGMSMAQTLLDAGAEYDLRPAGENAFTECLAKLSFKE